MGPFANRAAPTYTPSQTNTLNSFVSLIVSASPDRATHLRATLDH